MNKLPEHVLIIQSQGVDQARELKANPAAFIKKYNLLPKDQADHLSYDTKVGISCLFRSSHVKKLENELF